MGVHCSREFAHLIEVLVQYGVHDVQVDAQTHAPARCESLPAAAGAERAPASRSSTELTRADAGTVAALQFFELGHVVAVTR